MTTDSTSVTFVNVNRSTKTNMATTFHELTTTSRISKQAKDRKASLSSHGQPGWYNLPQTPVNCETPWGTVAEFIKPDGDHVLVRMWVKGKCYIMPEAVRIPCKWEALKQGKS